MSIRIMTKIWDCKCYEGATLLTLLALADWAGDDGSRIYPTVGQLCEKTRLDERHVRRILKSLQEEKVLVKVAQATGKPGVANEYRLDVGRIRTMSNLGKAGRSPEGGQDATPGTRPGDGGQIEQDGGQNALPYIDKPLSTTVIKPLSAVPGGTPDKPVPKAEKKQTSMIGTWEPGPLEREAATVYWRGKARPDLVQFVGEEVDHFLAHHRSRGTRMVSWPDAWQTWYVNALKMRRAPNGYQNGPIGTHLSEDRELLTWVARLEIFRFGAEADGTGGEELPVGYWDPAWGPKGQAPAAALAAFAKKHPARAVK